MLEKYRGVFLENTVESVTNIRHCHDFVSNTVWNGSRSDPQVQSSPAPTAAALLRQAGGRLILSFRIL